MRANEASSVGDAAPTYDHGLRITNDGRVRTTDLGLLYDPARETERSLCLSLGERLHRTEPSWSVHMNRPYRGTANGIGQQHRARSGAERLVPVEIEVNQKWVGDADWSRRVETLTAAVVDSLG